jgi:hypothetical protein
MSTIKFSAVAIAAMSVFSGAAHAQYAAAAGSSALRSTTLTLFANSCAGGSANAQVFQGSAADGGSNIRAVRCGAAGGKTFSLDTDGGSWRAYGTDSDLLANIQAQSALLGLKKIRALDLTLCPTTGGPISGSGVACSDGAAKPLLAGNVAAFPGGPTRQDIGFSDVNPLFFDSVTGADLGQSFNRPRGYVGWKPVNKGPSVTQVVQKEAVGIVFGVAASRTLYEALMIDQGITFASSPSCWGAGGAAGTADLTNESCAPTITKDQYRALSTANFGAANLGWGNLFKGTAAAGGVQLERRDQGSGTQATANAYFHGVACTPYFRTPAEVGDSGVPDPAYLVTENNATGDVLLKLNQSGVLKIGVVSRENNPSNSSAASGSTPAGFGWGFLKLGGDKGAVYAGLTSQADAAGTVHSATVSQGAYPHQNNAVRGLYDFVSKAWVLRDAQTTNADVLNIYNNVDTSFTPGAGTFRIAALSGTNGLGTATVTTGTYYERDGMSGACVGGVSN